MLEELLTHSLDYNNAMEQYMAKENNTVPPQKNKKIQQQIPADNNDAMENQGADIVTRTFLSGVRQVLIFLVSLAIVIGVIAIAASTLNQRYLAPVDETADYFIEITIPRGASVSRIASILEDQGIIRNKSVFKLTVDLMERSGKLRSGTYHLSPSMTMENVLDIISDGNTGDQEVRVTIKEGKTVEEIAAELVKMNLLNNTTEFLKLCNDVERYKNYSFISEMSEETLAGKKYALEGYLFPDTYRFYSNASANEIIVKMLNQFNKVYSNEIIQKAEALNMTTDEVVIMASIIEREAKKDDFTKVSAVFQNRLRQDMRFESCATVQYLIGSKKLVLSEQEMSIDSPYNTYRNAGLPAGAISNPGLAAIEAAVDPDATLLKEGYLFFCLTEPETGVLVFAKTNAEHEANKAKYRDSWLEHDNKL
ncbi:endolytic transglycosylase MltG [Clostridia bacterium OttesenSCG-928-F22]|nr:endolytic transglycosylase MltG [Clostridia bacterium OttesenSCG-928-F22]